MKRWAVPVAAIVVGLAGLAGFVSARRALEAERAEQTALREELEGWKRRAGDALRELEALRGALNVEEPDEPKGTAGKTAGGDDAGVRRELLKILTEKEEKLAAAAKELDSLRLRVDQLEQQLRVAAADAEKLSAGERELREQADASRRLAEVLQTELKGKSALAAQMETQNAQLRKREEEARERAARLGRLVEQAEDLQRRREMYLTNILRRYREVTDLYRTLNQQFSNPRDGASPANNDLSRVQNAIYQAEDDMRQLQGLNTQSARLQKEMAEARK